MKSTNPNHGARTLAVHAGEQPDQHTGASTPNLVMSSTYVVDEPLSFSATNMKEDMPFFYTRWDNPTTRQLELKLAALEGAEACATFASGMAASVAVLMSCLSAGDHLIVSDVNYAGTAEFVRDTLTRFGVEVSPVDTSDLEWVKNAIRPNTRLIWIETPANPILRLADIEALAAIAQEAGAELAVDSTFASPIATRPLALGADYVVHSLTKYIGGHGDAVGGAVLGAQDKVTSLVTEARVHYGGSMSPFNAWLIARGAATLPIRMRAHEENAFVVAEFLSGHPKVESVIYPGFETHPQHELAKRQMDNFSGMIAVRVKDGALVSEKMMEALQVVHYAVSLGHHRSLIFYMPTQDLLESSFRLSGQARERYESVAGDGLFRLSVGLEDAHDICKDLGRVLD